MKSLREKAVEIRDAGVFQRYMSLLLERASISRHDALVIEKIWRIVNASN